MTWEHGRQLAGMSKSGSTLSFGYDADGVRISKTVNGVETKYYTASDQILRMEKGEDVMDFIYDEAGMVFSVIHNGTPYYYVRNGQNDIVALVDQNANIIGQYSYDAWGKPLQTTGDAEIVSLNPFRYRGYVYDEETGLYYLLSRYYDPETGRYINADGLVSTGQGIGGTNMYSYCGNNPVVRCDPLGTIYDWNELWARMAYNLFAMNCAAFAEDLWTDPTNPGKSWGSDYHPGSISNPKNGLKPSDLAGKNQKTASKIVKQKTITDHAYMGRKFRELPDAFTLPRNGNIAIAVVYNQETGAWHYYRQISNPFAKKEEDRLYWIHKPSGQSNEIIEWDQMTGMRIADPATDSYNETKYGTVLGYFEIGLY